MMALPFLLSFSRRGARVAEWGGLENRSTLWGTEGSNPSLSASFAGGVMTIKNIVLDVGNVLVRWDPLWIIKETFPGREDHQALLQGIFKHQIWLDHNLG